MSPTNEFRVSWKREGLRRKRRRFAYLVTAERHAALLRESDKDPHWKCDESHGRQPGLGPDEPEALTCMPPLVDGPVIEVRPVGEWTPVLYSIFVHVPGSLAGVVE